MAALDVVYENNNTSRAMMKIFSSVPGCIESLARLCEDGIRGEITDKSIVAEGKQLVIHFAGGKVPPWVIDEMNKRLSTDNLLARATVYNSASRY